MTDLDLPLFEQAADPVPDPRALARDLAQHEEALLDAFKHSGLRRHGFTFQRAVESDPIRRCLAVAAEIRIRKQLQGTTTCAA